MRKAALLCGTLSLAVFVSFYLLPESVLLPAAGVCALLSALSLLLPRGKGRARAHLALLGAAIGLFAFFVQEHFLAAPSDALAGEKRVISVRVTDYPDIYDTSEYLTVLVTDPELPGVKCRIASYDTENFTALTPGDELSIPVKLLPARERNGQSVDTYAAQGIFLRATATGAPEITGRWDFSFLYAPKALCRAIGEICRSVFPPDVQPFLTALLTGDKTDLYDDGAHYYALADAGLAHVVAVSGMHIAFLMGFLFLLIGRRPWAVAVGLPVLLLFAAMTGFTPSVTRAAVMQFFLLAAPLFGRESDGVTSLLTALALLLLLNPSACASVSLQLSFSSVAGIWFLSDRMYRALSRRIEDLKIAENRHARRVLLFAAGSVSSSIGAMALSAPLTAVHFGSVSVVSPISNILCLWIVSAVYIGGYIIVLLGAFLPGAAALAGSVLAWGVRYIYAVSGFLSRLPCANVYVRNPLFLGWLALVYALFFAAWLRSRKTGRFRALAPICVSLALLFAAAGVTETPMERYALSHGARRRAGRMHRSHERRAHRGDRLRRKLGYARCREKRRAVPRRRMPEEHRRAHPYAPPHRPRQRRGAALIPRARRHALSAARNGGNISARGDTECRGAAGDTGGICDGGHDAADSARRGLPSGHRCCRNRTTRTKTASSLRPRRMILRRSSSATRRPRRKRRS